MLLGVNTHNDKSVIEYINGNEKADQKASKSATTQSHSNPIHYHIFTYYVDKMKQLHQVLILRWKNIGKKQKNKTICSIKGSIQYGKTQL